MSPLAYRTDFHGSNSASVASFVVSVEYAGGLIAFITHVCGVEVRTFATQYLRLCYFVSLLPLHQILGIQDDPVGTLDSLLLCGSCHQCRGT